MNVPRPEPDRLPVRLPARRRLLGAAAALTLFAFAPGCGAAPTVADAPLVRVEVIDRDADATLQVYSDHGRPVVAGRPGARYALRLVNTSARRVLAVVAIDGVNVVTGETAGIGQRGYVLEPWQATAITGWRKSDDEVAAFEFTALADSYAARTGRPQDVGVIGVAVFREAQPLPPPSVLEDAPSPRMLPLDAAPPAPAPAPRTAFNSAAPAAPAAPVAQAPGRGFAAVEPSTPGERLGTGHGAHETSFSRTTTFQRASSQPAQRVEIRYDSLDNLVAAGIVAPPRVASSVPRAFPADPPRAYVPDPPPLR